MMGHHDTLGLLLQLRANQISRNRSFDLFHQPEARRALRVHLLLRQLERDLRRHTRQSVQVWSHADENGPLMVVEMTDDALRLRRRVYLSGEEFHLLTRDPYIAQLLLSDESG